MEIDNDQTRSRTWITFNLKKCAQCPDFVIDGRHLVLRQFCGLDYERYHQF